jgi:[acyl-carrier-protein] S-malonyltransferase
VFRTALREAEPRGPTSGLRLLSGIDGDWVENFEAGSEKLATQIATPLNWAACLESCWAAGARRALEPGPGTALNRMVLRSGAGPAETLEHTRAPAIRHVDY